MHRSLEPRDPDGVRFLRSTRDWVRNKPYYENWFGVGHVRDYMCDPKSYNPLDGRWQCFNDGTPGWRWKASGFRWNWNWPFPYWSWRGGWQWESAGPGHQTWQWIATQRPVNILEARVSIQRLEAALAETSVQDHGDSPNKKQRFESL